MTVADLTKIFNKYTLFRLCKKSQNQLTLLDRYYFSEIPIDVMDKIVCEAKVNALYDVEIVFED